MILEIAAGIVRFKGGRAHLFRQREQAFLCRANPLAPEIQERAVAGGSCVGSAPNAATCLQHPHVDSCRGESPRRLHSPASPAPTITTSVGDFSDPLYPVRLDTPLSFQLFLSLA